MNEKPIGTLSPKAARAAVERLSEQAVRALRQRDFKTLSGLVHPKNGIFLAPYTHLDPKRHVHLTAAQVRALWFEKKPRHWGVAAGSGDAIHLPFREFYRKWLFPKDFTRARNILFNTRVPRGNTINNLPEVFPDGVFVEHFLPGCEKYAGLDWRSLWLVWENHDKNYSLVAIASDSWTP